MYVLASYVARYASESSIFSETLGITLSKSVSQRRASGHCDMTPNITGTRRASVDHDCCATLGVAKAVARPSDKAVRMIVGNIGPEEGCNRWCDSRRLWLSKGGGGGRRGGQVASSAPGPHVFSGSDPESPQSAKFPERARFKRYRLKLERLTHQVKKTKSRAMSIADFEPHPTTSDHPPQIVAVQSTCIERRTLVMKHHQLIVYSH